MKFQIAVPFSQQKIINWHETGHLTASSALRTVSFHTTQLQGKIAGNNFLVKATNVSV
jgi:hypothetical protein